MFNLDICRPIFLEFLTTSLLTHFSMPYLFQYGQKIYSLKKTFVFWFKTFVNRWTFLQIYFTAKSFFFFWGGVPWTLVLITSNAKITTGKMSFWWNSLNVLRNNWIFFAKGLKNVLEIFSQKLVPLKMSQESIGSRNQVEVGVNPKNKIPKSF